MASPTRASPPTSRRWCGLCFVVLCCAVLFSAAFWFDMHAQLHCGGGRRRRVILLPCAAESCPAVASFLFDMQLEQIATSATSEQGLGYLNTRDALNISLGWVDSWLCHWILYLAFDRCCAREKRGSASIGVGGSGVTSPQLACLVGCRQKRSKSCAGGGQGMLLLPCFCATCMLAGQFQPSITRLPALAARRQRRRRGMMRRRWHCGSRWADMTLC